MKFPAFNILFFSICERITPRLAHANAAVVLSAVKVLMKMMDLIKNTEFVQMLQKKLAPPLVTLLSSEPEIQVSFVYHCSGKHKIKYDLVTISSPLLSRTYHTSYLMHSNDLFFKNA